MADRPQPANQPVTHAELAAILDAGTTDAPREQTSSVTRMLNAIVEMTGVTLDDLLASVDLARAAANPGPYDRIDPLTPHIYRVGPGGLGSVCLQRTTLGLCDLPLRAPVHIPQERSASRTPQQAEPPAQAVEQIHAMAAASKQLLGAALMWTGGRTREDITGRDELAVWDAAAEYRAAYGEPPLHHHAGDVLGQCVYQLPTGGTCGRLIEASVHYEPAVSNRRTVTVNLGKPVPHSATVRLIAAAEDWQRTAYDPGIPQMGMDAVLERLDQAVTAYREANGQPPLSAGVRYGESAVPKLGGPRRHAAAWRLLTRARSWADDYGTPEELPTLPARALWDAVQDHRAETRGKP